MEADGDGTVTARNVYGGPLLFREVYSEAGAGDVDGNPEKVTYSYLYNAHGDVVTLLSGGEVMAAYSYDAFGNLTGQTGEADNSVLYAGHQYDVETGLYYLIQEKPIDKRVRKGYYFKTNWRPAGTQGHRRRGSI